MMVSSLWMPKGQMKEERVDLAGGAEESTKQSTTRIEGEDRKGEDDILK
jgi:hypothetical protein